MPLKICQLCTVDFTLQHFLKPLMAALREQGHEVVGVCAPGELVDRVRADGFRVETMPLRRTVNPFQNLRAGLALRRLFRDEGFDMVHAHTPVAAFVGRLAAAGAGVPRVVYTAHGFYFHEHMPPLRQSVHIAVEWLAGRFTDTLFTQAEEDAATARRLGLCRTGDVMAIGNGCDPAVFHPPDGDGSRHAIRASLGTPGDRTVILTAGRLVAEKGYRELVEAMRGVDAELWAVGPRLKSDHAAGIEDVVNAAENDPDLRERIRFLGYRSDMPELLRAADIFTLPSHREGMPRSVIEAMLTGLPVVATNIRGTREEVVDGETGLLVPVRDIAALAGALNSLVADAARRAELGQAGLARARAHFVEDMVIERQLTHLGLLHPGPGDRPS